MVIPRFLFLAGGFQLFPPEHKYTRCCSSGYKREYNHSSYQIFCAELGRFRFCFYDLDFGGCGGSGEAYANTIRDDNYNTNVDAEGNYYNDRGLLGQNLKEAMNPSIQCFIMLMSNE